MTRYGTPDPDRIVATRIAMADTPDPRPYGDGTDLMTSGEATLATTPITDMQIHRARRTVAAHADDTRDCRRLLDMLGLLSHPAEHTPPAPEPDPDPAGIKRCSRCRQRKSTDEFYLDRKNSDGLKSWCRTCHNKVTTIAWRKRKAREAAS